MAVREGFKKVAQSGGGYVVATFYNPTTGEEYTKCVRDYDYADCSRDDDEAYNMEIDPQVCREWKHKYGMILVGDTVEVYKGRKVKKGTVAEVVKIYPIYDTYKRWLADYAILSTGEKTNVNNCRLLAVQKY